MEVVVLVAVEVVILLDSLNQGLVVAVAAVAVAVVTKQPSVEAVILMAVEMVILLDSTREVVMVAVAAAVTKQPSVTGRELTLQEAADSAHM